MMRIVIPGVLASLTAVALVLALNTTAYSGEAYGTEKGTQSRYLIVSPHTSENCLEVLDNIQAQGADALGKYDWGCMVGDHTGYATVSAASEAEALKMVPASVRSQAKAIKLNKFTSEQLKKFHQEM